MREKEEEEEDEKKTSEAHQGGAIGFRVIGA